MKIALLGYGKEGQAAENYFKTKHQDATFDIVENETPEELKQRDYSSYDIIIRSPSIPPLYLDNETSLTRYFFDHCPCPIIGVTATKGKGTTCSFIKSLLDAEHADAYLVGNIGNPAIDVLDDLEPTSVVVYEMSSFQLWDLEKSPHIAIIGQLEPDHLNVHKDYDDYLAAKAHITKYQTDQDYLIYYSKNPETVKIAETSQAQKIPYPFNIPDDIKDAVKLPGKHNEENAIAAIAAVAAFKNISPDEYLATSSNTIKQGLASFKGLPHRLEFVRELNKIKYYDDNFSTNPASTKVAIEAFPNSQLTVIIGGRDKTDYEDLPEIYRILQSPNVKNIILIGESGHELAQKYDDPRFRVVESLEEAVTTAKDTAEQSAPKGSESSIVLMSPSAASFDMFKNVYDRGTRYKTLINKY
ncbi:MAG: UDP-N-acetylmuramoyl-L-alanine--D-glutamate ligase [Candidatus Saccharibacteria bacterium]|nr:UDP-N-acetylmuramoyl-L-alanine--D-glutamate ligase [Candidatus Saccharibacteria bacterium]